MKITKKEEKQILFHCFFEIKQTPQGEQQVPKQFDISELLAAGSAKRKLYAEKKALEDGREYCVFDNSEVEFTPDEIVILKKCFDLKKQWPADLAEEVLAIKNLFEGKK